jgi:dienelactone hydrolase
MLTEFFCWAFFFLLPASLCQVTMPPDLVLLRASNQAADLKFPVQLSSVSSLDIPRMAVFKPDGDGPFPGLVLFHQCAGLGIGRRPNRSMLQWAHESVASGYTVLLIDSFSERGVDTVCFGPKGGVNFPRGVKDALLAAAHLRKFDFVDKKRVALAGYSWGAMVGMLSGSKRWSETLAPGEGFAAVVSFYPGCFTIRPPSGTPYEIVQHDIDRSLLVLMGEDDNETPAGECVAKLDQAKAAGAPVDWHVYPETTHCWDCRQLDNFSKIDMRGNRVTYRYSEEVTRDSAQRMFAFLEKKLSAYPTN